MPENDLTQIANLAVVRRLMEEGFGEGDVQWLPSVTTDDYVGHLTQGDHYGPDGIRIDIAGFHALLADFSVTIEDMFACGNKVVRRFTFRGRLRSSPADASAIHPSQELRGIAVDRFVDGKLAESWVQLDPLPR